jgi:DNA repair protein RecO (recombination protein O)
METVRTDALILKTIPYSETSAIIQVMTPNGRVSLMAKGAFRPKGKFYGILQPLFLIEAIYRYKEGRDIHTLTDVTVKNHFRGFFDDFEKNVYASAIAEVCLQLFHEGDLLGEEFSEIIRVLKVLEKGECPPANAFLSFLHALISYSGFALSVKECAGCGKENTESDIRIDMENGTYLCGGCLKENGIKANMARKRFLLLRDIEEKKICKEKIHREDEEKLLNFYLAYIRYHWKSDLKIKSFDLL